MNRKPRHTAPTPNARRPLFRALEQRLMFDAAVVDTAAQIAESAPAADLTTEPAQDDALLDHLAQLTPPAEQEVVGVAAEAFATQVSESAPAAVDDTATGRADRITTGRLLQNDNDPSGDWRELKVVAVNEDADLLSTNVDGSTGGTFSVDESGNWSFDPGSDFQPLPAGETVETSITVTVLDSEGFTSNSSLVFTVIGVNEAPADLELSNSTYYISAGEQAIGLLSSTDIDTDDTVTYSLLNDQSRALKIEGNALSVKPDTQISQGVYRVSVGARDSKGGFTSENFEITITDDVAPVITGDADPVGDSPGVHGSIPETATERTDVGITVTASDNGYVTYSLTDDAGGRFTIDDETGEISIAENVIFNAFDFPTHDITVQVTDSGGNTNEQTFRIAVTEMPPQLVDDYVEIEENPTEAASGGLFDNDQTPASEMTITAVNGQEDLVGQQFSGSAGGLFTIEADGSWRFDPQGQFENLYRNSEVETSVELTVTDRAGSVSTSILSITIVGQNDAPNAITLSGNSISLDGESQVVGEFRASDVDDGDSHNFTFATVDGIPNSNSAFRINQGRLELTDLSLAPGIHTVHVQARDRNGATLVETFMISVANSGQLSITGDSDTMGNTPDGNYHGAVREDTTAGTAVGITVSAYLPDASPQAVTYSLADDAGGRFIIDPASGVITTAEGAVFNWLDDRSHTVLAQASSGGLTASASFVVSVLRDQVTARNDSGFSTEAPEVLTGGNLLQNDPSATQPGAPLHVQAVAGSASNVGIVTPGSDGGQFTINADGSWQFDPAGEFTSLGEGQRANTSVTVTVANAVGFTTTSTLSISVSGENNVPDSITLDNQIYDVVGDSRVVGTLAATDADTDAARLRLTLTDNPDSDNTLFEIVNQQLLVKADTSLTPLQSYSVEITVSDGLANFTQVFEVRARDSETPMIIGDSDPEGNDTERDVVALVDEGYYDQSTPVGLTVTSDHAEAVTYSLDDTPLNPFAIQRFEIDPDSGVVSVKAGVHLNAEFYDRQLIVVRATDPQGDSSTYQFNIGIRNLAPTANNDWNTIQNDSTTPVSGNLFFNDTDPGSEWVDGDLIVTAVAGSDTNIGNPISGDNGGEFIINADGSWTFTPGNDFESLAPGESVVTTVTVTLEDKPQYGDSFSQESTLNVTVIAPAEIALSNDSLDLASDSSVLGSLSVEGFNGEAPYTYTLQSGEGDTHNSQFEIVGDTLNLLRQDPLQSPGEYSIRVRLSDADEQTVDTVLTIQLSNSDLPLVLIDNNPDSDGDGIDGSIEEGAEAGTDTGIRVAPDQPRLPITYSLTDSAGGLFTIDADTGVITTTSVGLFNAESGDQPFSVTVSATESVSGKTAEQSFVIQVTNVAYEANDDLGTATENGSPLESENLFSNDSDPGSTLPGNDVLITSIGNGGTIGQTLSGSNGGLFTVLANGEWQFDPNGEFEYLAGGETATTEISVTFEETLQTDDAVPVSSRIIVTVTGENDAPTLTDSAVISYQITEGQSFSLPLDSARVEDADLSHTASNRVYSLDNAPSWLALNASTLTGQAPKSGEFEVTVVATDPQGASVSYDLIMDVSEPAAASPATASNQTASHQAGTADAYRGSHNGDTAHRDNGRTDLPSMQVSAGDGALQRTQFNPAFSGATDAIQESAPAPASEPAPFDPSPFGPTSAGPAARPLMHLAERTLMPDGQFVERMPVGRTTRDYVLEVGLGVEDQNSYVARSFRYELSDATFLFTSGGERYVGNLTYSARLNDDSALPDWLTFDAEKITFEGTPPEGAEGDLQIRISAETQDGQKASLEFEIHILDNADETPSESAPGNDRSAQAALGDSVGKPSLQAQLDTHADNKTRLAEARLLQQLANITFE